MTTREENVDKKKWKAIGENVKSDIGISLSSTNTSSSGCYMPTYFLGTCWIFLSGSIGRRWLLSGRGRIGLVSKGVNMKKG